MDGAGSGLMTITHFCICSESPDATLEDGGITHMAIEEHQEQLAFLKLVSIATI